MYKGLKEKGLQELILISLSCFSNTVDSVSCNKVLCTWQVINTFCAQSKLFCFRITPILNYHKEKYSVKEILNSKSPNSFTLSDLRFLFMSSGGSHVLLQFRLHWETFSYWRKLTGTKQLTFCSSDLLSKLFTSHLISYSAFWTFGFVMPEEDRILPMQWKQLPTSVTIPIGWVSQCFPTSIFGSFLC